MVHQYSLQAWVLLLVPEEGLQPGFHKLKDISVFDVRPCKELPGAGCGGVQNIPLLDDAAEFEAGRDMLPRVRCYDPIEEATGIQCDSGRNGSQFPDLSCSPATALLVERSITFASRHWLGQLNLPPPPPFPPPDLLPQWPARYRPPQARRRRRRSPPPGSAAAAARQGSGRT